LPKANNDDDDDDEKQSGELDDVDAISVLLRLEGTSIGKLAGRSSPVEACQTWTWLDARIWVIKCRIYIYIYIYIFEIYIYSLCD